MSIQDRIKHVFVLMLENRSYDHIFGFSNVGDLAGNEGNVWNGQTFKLSAGADFAMPSDPGHGFLDVVQQLSGAAATYRPNGPFPKDRHERLRGQLRGATVTLCSEHGDKSAYRVDRRTWNFVTGCSTLAHLDTVPKEAPRH